MFAVWVITVLKVWYGWLPSSALAALMGYGQNILGWHISPRYYVTLVVLGFLYSFFTAWREEWVENRNGPQITLTWESSRLHHDCIKLRNVGTLAAFNVAIGDFSWPELAWHRKIEVQSLLPGNDEAQIEPQFFESAAGTGTALMGYMWRVVRHPSRNHEKPLTVTVKFADANRTQLERTFILSSSPADDRVKVELGDLNVVRP